MTSQLLQDAWDKFVLTHDNDCDANPIGYAKDVLLVKADLHYALFDRVLDEDACGGDWQERISVGNKLEKTQWTQLTNEQLGELVEWCNK
jgi:hypothetical protein